MKEAERQLRVQQASGLVTSPIPGVKLMDTAVVERQQTLLSPEHYYRLMAKHELNFKT